MTGLEQPTEVAGARVSGNLFRTLGVAPQLGRTFGDEADRPGGPREVVLSHDLWRTQLGGDPAIVGRSNTVVSTSVVLRSGGNPKALAGAVRNTIWSLSREVPISNLRSIAEVLAQSITRRRVVLTLLGAFALVGVLLGLVGIYSLVAHAVRQRTREIGIRMALGAAPRAALQLMISVVMKRDSC